MEEESTVDIAEDATLFGAGDRLRRAREAAGLKLEDVASETRISLRHLADIESGDWDALPGRTYAIGFARNFARAVGLDQNDIAAEVRSELDLREPSQMAASKFEPGDPARIPSSGLAWVSVLGVLLLGAGLFFFFRPYIFPAGELPPLERDETPAVVVNGTAGEAITGPAPVSDPSGAVTFTSLEEGIWVKFYDENGAQLMQKQMSEGERYTVPTDAAGPQLWTGRPDALAITIGGREMPKLAEEDQVMRDVPVSADALLARAEAAVTTTAASPAAAVSTN
jgi:cytoskeletal protein RodZ